MHDFIKASTGNKELHFPHAKAGWIFDLIGKEQWNSNEFMYSMIADEIDGGILTFTAAHPKWSFAKLDGNGFVSEVAEKVPISNIASVGIYFWKHGSDFVKYAEQMIEKEKKDIDHFGYTFRGGR